MTAHFEKIVANQPQVTAELSKKEQFKVSHIVAIDFARKDFSDYEVLQELQALIYKGIKHRYREINAKKESSKAKARKKINRIKDKIRKLKSEFNDCIKQKADNDIKYAFITFRTIEGQRRALRAMSDSITRRLWLKLTCRSKLYKQKIFWKHYPEVKRAVHPQIINWQNLGYSWKNRLLRSLVGFFFALILIVICCIINLYGTRADDAVQNFSPQVECSSGIVFTAEEAFADWSAAKASEEAARLNADHVRYE